jgi:hypothetical protein
MMVSSAGDAFSVLEKQTPGGILARQEELAEAAKDRIKSIRPSFVLFGDSLTLQVRRYLIRCLHIFK